MTDLIVKSEHAEEVKSAVRSALDSQQNVLRNSIKRTRRILASFEEKYGFDTANLLAQESDGTLNDDNLDFIEWIGEARTLEHLKAELELFEDINIC